MSELPLDFVAKLDERVRNIVRDELSKSRTTTVDVGKLHVKIDDAKEFIDELTKRFAALHGGVL